LLRAQSHLDDVDELLREIPNPDPDWEQDLPRLRSEVLTLLNEVAGAGYIAELKAGASPEIGYACEARVLLLKRKSDADGGVPKAIRVLEDASARGVTLGIRSLLLMASLLRNPQSGRAFDFTSLLAIYERLERQASFQPRTVDMFRHAVALYQVGQFAAGARKFKDLRTRLSREGLTPLRVRDVLRDPTTPSLPRVVPVRIVRVMSPWRAECYVEAFGQNIPLRPRHFAPPPSERQVVQCVIRFETNGPLAVPPRFEGL
jgi:hypothetical protein